MRFVCESCRAQYMINDEKVGPKGVKVRCRKCGYVILVKRADAAKSGGPVAMSNDPDDALATQVMQTPLAPAEATLSNEDTQANEMTSPGTNTSSPTLPGPEPKNGESKDSFFGADEDEIGAVFDQVLKGAPAKEGEGEAAAASGDDRQNTRVIDAETVRKLAEESGVVEKAAPAPKSEEVPQTDWYVAINEKQTGPLTLEKIKEHWDQGEISPDSLCWRAGFDDWIPVSEVKMLTSVLAPKPPKPIVVAPAATITQSSAVVSMPVQSAFSAGGMVQTVQSEVQVPMSAVAASSIADREESGSWKPSAASALASLVKDEMEALSKPPPKAPPAPMMDEGPLAKGLLDLPAASEEKSTNSAVALPNTFESRPSRPPPPAQAPVNPYLANPGATYSAPAVTQYRPPSNRNLMIGVAAGGGVLLLILIGLVVWLAVREPQVVVAPPPVAVNTNPPVANNNPPPVNNVPPPTNTVPPANTNPPTNVANPPANVANPPGNTNPPANVGNPPANTNPPTPVNTVQPPTPVTPKNTGGNKNTGGQTRNQPKETKSDPEPEPKKAQPKADEGDDFDKAFGGGGSSKSTPKEETARSDGPKKKDVYVPPAPGSETKEKLEQSDIMESVLAKKGDLAACTAKKEAGTSGKIVMKWTVATSGKVSNVGVAEGSEDFKGTPMATCFANVIKSMSFPKHKTQGEPVKFPFKF